MDENLRNRDREGDMGDRFSSSQQAKNALSKPRFPIRMDDERGHDKEAKWTLTPDMKADAEVKEADCRPQRQCCVTTPRPKLKQMPKHWQTKLKMEAKELRLDN